jgi:hypothetical protein
MGDLSGDNHSDLIAQGPKHKNWNNSPNLVKFFVHWQPVHHDSERAPSSLFITIKHTQ